MNQEDADWRESKQLVLAELRNLRENERDIFDRLRKVETAVEVAAQVGKTEVKASDRIIGWIISAIIGILIGIIVYQFNTKTNQPIQFPAQTK